MKPSEFTNMPQNSVLQDYRASRMARNIMFILRRTGNNWRLVEWVEYQKNFQNDPDFNPKTDPELFTKVAPYCISVAAARTFSHTWDANVI